MRKILGALVWGIVLVGCGSSGETSQEIQTPPSEVTLTPEAPLESQTTLLSLMSEEDWEWLFPFRFGKANPYGAEYNKGSSACERLGIEGSVEESDACDIYTLDTFKEAVQRYNSYAKAYDKPLFLEEGSVSQQAEELSAFFAHISRETSGTWSTAPVEENGWIEDDSHIGMVVWKGGLYWLEEIGHTTNLDGSVLEGGVGYVDSTSIYTPVENRSYHGRGPIQLSWNYNYGALSAWLYTYEIYPEVITSKETLLQNPSLVERDALVGFLSAIWFWMTPQGQKPSSHAVMLGEVSRVASSLEEGLPPLRSSVTTTLPLEEGESKDAEVVAYRFGATINIVNGGLECGLNAQTHQAPTQRVSYFNAYTTYWNYRYGLDATSTHLGYIALERVSDESSVLMQFATCYAQASYGSF